MVEVCGACEGSGLRLVNRAGAVVAMACECQVERRVARMLSRARIPKLYEHSTLENYEIGFRGANKSLAAARFRAQSFVEGYPVQTDGRGLLLTGSVGVGKTHLAIAILRTLITSRGASGLFYGYPDLLKEVLNTYNRQVATTELDVLSPVFNAEVLVLDEFGASKPSEWVSDIVAHILNTRYNERRTTIITTNFPNLEELPREEWGKLTDTQKAARKETLGDRIGERMRSRLQEMCVTVEMSGIDFRTKVKPARFASEPTECFTAFTPESAVKGNGPSVGKGLQIEGADEAFHAEHTRIGKPGARQPGPEEKPLAGGARMSPLTATKRTMAESELQVDAEVNNPNYRKVYQDGKWVPMITGSEQEDERDAASRGSTNETQILGSDRMGKNKREKRDVGVW
jgi:DNA replication protein DnaC